MITIVTPPPPPWASPPFMIQPLSATSRVMKIGLTTTDPDLDLIDLSMTTYWKIRTRLMRVPAVADALDPGLLQYNEGNYIGRGGFIDTPTNRYQVRHILPIVDAEDLGQIP